MDPSVNDSTSVRIPLYTPVRAVVPVSQSVATFVPYSSWKSTAEAKDVERWVSRICAVPDAAVMILVRPIAERLTTAELVPKVGTTGPTGPVPAMMQGGPQAGKFR